MTSQKKTPDLGWSQAQLKNISQHFNADVHALLSRLEKVKETRQGCWQACCPAHDDRTPSLTIRETDNGTILLKCWTGCGAADVVAAVGLEMQDLFPRRERNQYSKPMRPGERWVPRDVLAALAREALIVLLATETVKQGRPLTDSDIDRLAAAAGHLRNAAREVGAHV